MDIASSYLDYEICLSRRSDLIPAVLAHVLHARLPECIEAELHVCAHEVRNAEVVTLCFLIEERSAAPQRNRLIVGGEMLLDKLFAASPWQSAPMVMEATSKRPVRPEIHVKCRPTDEETWYARRGAQASLPAAMWRLTTDRLRAMSLHLHEIKNVLPVLIHRRCSEHEWDHRPDCAFSQVTDDARRTLMKKALGLHERGEVALVPEALTTDEHRRLDDLERYLDEAAKLVGETNVLVTLRFLLAQMGFSDMEADYTIMLGFIGRKDFFDKKEAA